MYQWYSVPPNPVPSESDLSLSGNAVPKRGRKPNPKKQPTKRKNTNTTDYNQMVPNIPSCYCCRPPRPPGSLSQNNFQYSSTQYPSQNQSHGFTHFANQTRPVYDNASYYPTHQTNNYSNSRQFQNSTFNNHVQSKTFAPTDITSQSQIATGTNTQTDLQNEREEINSKPWDKSRNTFSEMSIDSTDPYIRAMEKECKLLIASVTEDSFKEILEELKS